MIDFVASPLRGALRHYLHPRPTAPWVPLAPTLPFAFAVWRTQGSHPFDISLFDSRDPHPRGQRG
eukprot:871767-Rhodomonas_salina.1